MDVFLIPVGRSTYELYYEPSDEERPPDADLADGGGLFQRWRQRFREMLHEAEQERHRPTAAPEPQGLLARGHRRMMRFVVERIAEWRVLWHLRSADVLVAYVPDDLGEDPARQIIRGMLKADADRHLRWVVINLLLLAASAPLMFVPGPNVAAYFFTFNVVGHGLAWLGARRGLHRIPWRIEPTPVLSELRAALVQAEPYRERTVHDVAERLRLQHLVSFFRRIAIPTA